jgi:glyoxylase I family protein
MSFIKYSHIGLNCKDPLVTERFYTRHFGFERARVIPIGEGKQIVFLKSGAAYIELFPAEGVSPVQPFEKDGPAYPGVRHFAFQVDDVDAKLAELGKEGHVTFGPFGFDDVIPGWRTVWVSDPDGNIVEISQGYIDQVNPAAAPAA